MLEKPDDHKAILDPTISIGHIVTLMTLVFMFGGFYTLTDYRIKQTETLIGEHSRNIEKLMLDNAKTQALLDNGKRNSTQ